MSTMLTVSSAFNSSATLHGLRVDTTAGSTNAVRLDRFSIVAFGGGPVSTDWLLPTAQTIEAGSGTWTNSSNILADDGTEASFSLTSKNTDGSWNVGQMLGFDSTIPATSSITAVQIRADWRVTSAGGIGNLDLAAFVTGSSTGQLRSNTSEPTSLTTNTFTITFDRDWTRDDLLNSTFELKVRGRNGNSATDPFYRFDHIAARVSYSPEPVVGGEAVRIRYPSQPDGMGVGGIFYGNRVS
jgi:hypothetical protein